MAGVRIQHRKMRGGMAIVQDPRPVPPYFCPRCAATAPSYATHTMKTHHIDIDSDGYAIVSVRVWDRLQGLFKNAGFRFQNFVQDPPPLRIDQGMSIDGKTVNPALAGAVLLEGESSNG